MQGDHYAFLNHSLSLSLTITELSYFATDSHSIRLGLDAEVG